MRNTEISDITLQSIVLYDTEQFKLINRTNDLKPKTKMQMVTPIDVK